MKSEIKITNIIARQILDSRGNPTIEVDVTLENGIIGRASIPSGASTGEFEAVELRDNEPKCYNGKSVLKAVNNVNTQIAKLLKGVNVFDQKMIDQKMINLDATHNKSKLGANAILGVSLACARAGALAKNIPMYKYLGGVKANILPIPFMNILNGGKHANNTVNIQEFMIAPVGAKTFNEAMQMGAEIYQSLKKVLQQKNYNTTVGDEGGFAPNLDNDEQALILIVEAIKNAGYIPNKDIKIALDVAASEMYNEAEKINKNGYYFWKTKQFFTTSELIDYYENLIKKYPIMSIEDGLGENDWTGWQEITRKLGNKIQLVGDDLFVTNPTRLKQGIEQKTANAILIKPNQIGSLTETLETIQIAKKANYNCMISHRSGETEDTFISDLVVATGTGQIKTGAPCRGERVAKYNQLMRIEEQLGSHAKYFNMN